ncbi:conserved hypothetical protein [Janthinobacterium agaricidamnosum NBRC 102515 = DSM 9628]|uniref:TIGR03016 family PEP-CTERM system-associated outer membrane protein n=1 Tax=Janthinobacterium agaricidamnosum NBRC 102515 = DSM 9628 TaxID=1349767 RepID=W0V7M2_9BURK|nr:conserved hypothetical protein [Janthinobacterium agaricidamnosum NBRC 102515 = DSM 9628]
MTMRHPAAGLCTLLVMTSMAPARTSAADWTVNPALRLRESYSDNILLAAPGQTRSDLITEIAPSIALIGSGPRLRIHLDYTLQKLFYRHQADTTNHQLAADAAAELLEDWLFADARAHIAQHNISAFGGQTVDNLPQGDNSTTVRTLTLSPYLRHRLRGLATAELRYTHDQLKSGNDLLSVRSDALLFQLDGDTDPRSLGWNARYDRKRTEDGLLAPVDMRKTTLSLRYPLSSKLNLFGSGGHEDEGYAANAGAASQGRFWSLGAGWYPSARSSLVASTGKRFFGNTYTLDASHRSRYTSWALSYSEDITSSPAQFSRLSPSQTASMLDQLWSGLLPDALQRRQRIIAFLRYSQALGPDAGAVNYFSHRYFLQKQFKLSMLRATGRSTFVLAFNATDRNAQTSSGIDSALLPPSELALQDRTRQTGINSGWSWRMSPRNNVNASAGYGTIASASNGRKDANLALNVGLSRTLQPKVTAAVDLRHLRHTSNRGGDYRENGVSATLTILF